MRLSLRLAELQLKHVGRPKSVCVGRAEKYTGYGGLSAGGKSAYRA